MAIQLETEKKTKIRHMPLYKVIMHNDPKTTMEFVVLVLMGVFNKDQQEAKTLTMEIHETGQGLAGVFPLEHAEMKVEQTHSLARTKGFPLTCTIEPA